MANDFHNQTSSFLTWFKKLPGTSINPKIDLWDFREKGAGRGLVALEDIAKDEELFSLPSKCVLSVRNSDLRFRVPEIERELDVWLSLILVLIYEFQRGDQSFWKPYFDILPEQFDTLMYWSAAEITELQGSAIVEKIGKEEADDKFALELIPIIRRHNSMFFGDDRASLDDKQLLELAHRMGSTVMAYAFDIDENGSDVTPDEDGFIPDEDDEDSVKVMVPMADMLNADVSCNARLNYEGGVFSMRATEGILTGSEILNDYGPLPRSDLLRRYGYTATSYAVFDIVELPRGLILEAVKDCGYQSRDELDIRLIYLEAEDVAHEAFILGWDAGDQPIPEELLTFVQSLLAERNEYKGIVNIASSRRIQLRNDSHQVIRRALNIRLNQYGTTIVEDETLLNGDKTLTQRRKQAISVRLGEKRILQQALDHLSLLVVQDGHSSQNLRKRKAVN